MQWEKRVNCKFKTDQGGENILCTSSKMLWRASISSFCSCAKSIFTPCVRLILNSIDCLVDVVFSCSTATRSFHETLSAPPARHIGQCNRTNLSPSLPDNLPFCFERRASSASVDLIFTPELPRTTVALSLTHDLSLTLTHSSLSHTVPLRLIYRVIQAI